MTNGWVDIKNADVVLAMGGNPAENHPCGFKWAIEAKKTRNAKLVVVDPRFTRTAAVADVYAQLRPGTDIAFLNGIIRYAIETKRFHEEYVKLFTNAALHHQREVRLQRGAVQWLGRRDKGIRQVGLGVPAKPHDQRLRRRPYASASSVCLPASEEARRPLHPGDGGAGDGDAQGEISGSRPRWSPRPAMPKRWAPSPMRSAGRSTRSACR